VRVIPGVGPATDERLRRAGIHTVADLESADLDELVRLLGKAQGTSLHQLARAEDDRAVVSEQEAKSVSVESTYDTDLTDTVLMESLVTRQAREVAERLRRHGLSGRTVSIKVRLYDFTTLSRSTTLPSPTDAAPTIARLARTLLGELVSSGATSGGVRLLGVGVAGLADWVQEDLFGAEDATEEAAEAEAGDAGQVAPGPEAPLRQTPTWPPGADVVHEQLGRGWVWGAGRGVVTVRFETASSPVGPVRSFAADDPALSPWSPPEDAATPGTAGPATAGT
jgi:DNA polymerase-4